MYLLPEKLKLNELVGHQINMICVGPYDAQVKFENGIIIQSSYKLEFEVKGLKTLCFDCEWLDTSSVHIFVTKEVVSVIRESDTVFRIELTGDSAICFHTEESMYESINIIMPDGTLEVI
ncbi:hypothetical protein [Desulforegula conservatrix]|uniref:hypothetical protein n=1 Tax=Desulforegula conservatrix TaxID=153026 RepID=UPI000484BAF5|nr:hypothetical protein [Desulforegula conservatrix]